MAGRTGGLWKFEWAADGRAEEGRRRGYGKDQQCAGAGGACPG